MNNSSFFDLTKPIVLSTSVVELRPLQEADYELLLPFALNEPDLWTYSLVSAAGEAGMKNYLQIALNAKNQLREYPFIVFDKRTQQYAGSTRYYDIQLPMQSLQLGYTWYGKQFQGTGLNTHCKYLLLAHAFENMGIERVEFRADANNAKSIRAMKKIGCIEEGILRSNTPKLTGGRRDSIVLSILKQEWVEKIKPMLEEKIK
ncbi:MAG: GNAT family N-acetyltransferase [Bacteroidetes bacterium]|nr:GNAT family N-acetyltransferase [Bacteroidota bacterium]